MEGLMEAVKSVLENATRHDNFVAVTLTDYRALVLAYSAVSGEDADGTRPAPEGIWDGRAEEEEGTWR